MMGTEGGTKNLRYDASLGHFGRWKARVCAASVSSVVAKTEDRPAKAQRALAKFARTFGRYLFQLHPGYSGKCAGAG